MLLEGTMDLIIIIIILPSGTIEWRWNKICLDCGYTSNEGVGAFGSHWGASFPYLSPHTLRLDSLHVIHAPPCMLLVALLPVFEHGTVLGKLNVSAPYWARASAVKRASVSSGNVVKYGKHRLYGHLWGWWLCSFQHFGMECFHVIVPLVAPLPSGEMREPLLCHGV